VVREILVLGCVLGATATALATPIPRPPPCSTGTYSQFRGRLVADLRSTGAFGPLETGESYGLSTSGEKYLYLDLTSTRAGNAPPLELVGNTLRVGGAPSSALLVSFVGPRGALTYLVPTGKETLPTWVVNEGCLADVGLTAANTCLEVAAISPKGRITPPANVCGELQLGARATLVIESPQYVSPEIDAARKRAAQIAAGKDPWPAQHPSAARSARSSARHLPPWWAFCAVVAAAFLWSFVRRNHALSRYGASDEPAVDRDTALRAAQRMRVILIGCAVGTAASVAIGVATFDVTNPLLCTSTILFAAWSLAAMSAAWRTHRAIALIPNPDIVVTSDQRTYVFVTHGTELLRFVALPRRMLIPALRALPVARIVSGS